jgi:hypothetical protein
MFTTTTTINEKKRSRDIPIDDDVFVIHGDGDGEHDHDHDSMPPTKKKVKTHHQEQQKAAIVVDPCILTSMNLVFPPMDIVDAFIAAATRSRSVEKRKRRSNDDNVVVTSPLPSAAAPIVTATQLIFPLPSSELSSPSPFTESLKKKRKIDNDGDKKPAVSDDEDRKPSAAERYTLLLNNNKSKNEAAAAVIYLDCTHDEDDDVVVPLPTMKTAPSASMPAVATVSSSDGDSSDDDDDDSDDEIQIVGSKGDNALPDYPHSRADCVVFRFGKTTTSHHGGSSECNKFHCKNCYCFVCDKPSLEFEEWSDNHCNAISSGCLDSKWEKLRKQKRDAAERAATTRSSKKKTNKTATATAKRATTTTTTTTFPRRKKQITKTKSTATKTTAKAKQRAEIRARVKAQFESVKKNAAASKKKAPPTAAATIATIPAPTTITTNEVAPHHQYCFKCSKGMQQHDIAVTDQFGQRFCFDCIITSVTNNGNTCGNGNAPINLTGTGGKTCSSCGQEGHCLRTSKKCPIYWQRRKESAPKRSVRL